jgi:hypothetical protein
LGYCLSYRPVFLKTTGPADSSYTDDRRDNFDIYLPVWIARHNKAVFGSLFGAGVAYTIAQWFAYSCTQ